jgi:hypothetical protein
MNDLIRALEFGSNGSDGRVPLRRAILAKELLSY